ncbi:hypothetical protein [Streptomyces sp. NPDC048565]|uniref:hypothetical protein n=1 Tax=Streptomyces sp. NPDC048565 TaxID=3155266 RepID=UPI00343E68D5
MLRISFAMVLLLRSAAGFMAVGPGGPSASTCSDPTFGRKSSVRSAKPAVRAPDTGAAYTLLSTRCRKDWSEEDLGALVDHRAPRPATRPRLAGTDGT